jgi:hypothetical protein
MRYTLTSHENASSANLLGLDAASNTTDFLPTNDIEGFAVQSGLSFAAATPSVAPIQVLYLQERGDTATISVNDLHQGQIGDCFLISSIGEIALEKPLAITNMIKVNSNGSETVTLYEGSNGSLPSFNTTSFRPVSINVTNIFPSYSVNNGATQDLSGNLKEIWPQVLEKAFATLNGGYAGIANGGSPVLALEELTGQRATWMAPANLSYNTLINDVAAGDLIVMDTSSKANLPYNLVSNHAYMFEKLTTINGTPSVVLGNPWGTDQPTAIPLSQLSKVFVEIDIGRV